MKMNEAQLARFNATSGAYSIVTAREAGHDKAITIDRYELEVLKERYTDFCRRIDGTNVGEPHKQFMRDPIDDFKHLVSLSIKYPKTNKTELRLYMSRRFGFYGKEGDVFFIYTLADCHQPVVGFLSQEKWNETVSNV